ncbi:hypothetical protein LWI28_028057 [Acer negundo]|uniref:Peptidase A1 domain-containing protein n=1 Tax=Acer negundo TaxID=4023 RepID=A0AAD5JI21_ACENE|nr:hypothetical protein LWI28_028057 [Acer negundo]
MIMSASIPMRLPKRLIIKLIHRDSVRSPYYNQNENVSDRALETSISRYTYLQAKIKSSSWNENYEADILPSINASLFFMNFSIGRPPIPQFTVMDTGSSLSWVQCLPCNKCYQQLGPIFDPSKSSTYSDLSCNSQYCRYNPGGTCNLLRKCSYNLTYIDGVSSSGILARETLTFQTSDEGRISIPSTIFGCSHSNGKFHDSQLTGVFGLGFGKLSLVSQLASTFSYCIGNLQDPNYIHNKLVLGDGARIEGDSTPLEVINGRYYITLEGISVGERKVDIDPNIFKRKTHIGKDGGVVIDTGSPATWLVTAGFEALRDQVQALLDVWLTRSFLFNSWNLCYDGVINRDVVGFPAVTFHFADGADLVLDRESLFLQAWPNVFCMAVFPSFDTSLSLVGMMAQQNYNVAFDVSGKKVAFQRIDCQLLDD